MQCAFCGQEGDDLSPRSTIVTIPSRRHWFSSYPTCVDCARRLFPVPPPDGCALCGRPAHWRDGVSTWVRARHGLYMSHHACLAAALHVWFDVADVEVRDPTDLPPQLSPARVAAIRARQATRAAARGGAPPVDDLIDIADPIEAEAVALQRLLEALPEESRTKVTEYLARPGGLHEWPPLEFPDDEPVRQDLAAQYYRARALARHAAHNRAGPDPLGPEATRALELLLDALPPDSRSEIAEMFHSRRARGQLSFPEDPRHQQLADDVYRALARERVRETDAMLGTGRAPHGHVLLAVVDNASLLPTGVRLLRRVHDHMHNVILVGPSDQTPARLLGAVDVLRRVWSEEGVIPDVDAVIEIERDGPSEGRREWAENVLDDLQRFQQHERVGEYGRLLAWRLMLPNPHATAPMSAAEVRRELGL